MCRHLAWLGEPRTLAALVLEPEHGLLRQSYQPRRQQRGLMNADGWGVGYFTPGRDEPARWRSDRPLWSSASFLSVAPTISSGAVLAAVRSATVGMPADETASAPFTDGRWLLSHNGVVDRAVLPPTRDAESTCDSGVLAAHVFAQVTAEGAADAAALGELVRKVGAADPTASLNLLLTDGRRILATTWADPASYLVEPDGVVVASEPWDDDPRWVDVPDRHLIEATSVGVTVTPLEGTSVTVRLDPDALARQLADDVRAGLTATPKVLPPKYFYDARGSELFDEITRLPEYYPTRTERAILEMHAGDIAAASRAETLLELGSGTSEKTRILLHALRDAGTLRRFVPFDVDPVVLEEAARSISAELPGVVVEPEVGDFERHLGDLPRHPRTMVAFLGSTVGNLEPVQRAPFLRAVRDLLGPPDEGGTLLLGTDLVKDPARLVAAYDDSQGVTAAFNKNVLAVIRRTLDADLDLDAFRHVAVWNAEWERIEMHLESTRDQVVHLGALGLDVPFAAGERVRTEISAKFRREGVTAELAAAGLELTHWLTDPAGDFALSLSRPG